MAKSASESATTSDQRLAGVTVGERQPLNSTIHLALYDPAWPGKFDAFAREIRAALGHKVLTLEHVGSTAISGLPAKPIVDMVLEVSDSRDESAFVPPLEGRGFVLRIREPDWFEHRLLKTPEWDGNLHVFSNGCEEAARMIRFRDYLRTHPDDRRRYEEVKRALAARTWKHTQDYADAKSGVIREIMARTGDA